MVGVDLRKPGASVAVRRRLDDAFSPALMGRRILQGAAGPFRAPCKVGAKQVKSHRRVGGSDGSDGGNSCTTALPAASPCRHACPHIPCICGQVLLL